MKSAPGFTLIELTVAMTLAVLLLGLVVIRLNFGSDRQQVVNAARRLGNMFETYRERAIADERLYAMLFDTDTGTCSIYQPVERNEALLQTLQPVKFFKLQPPLTFSKIMLTGRELSKPAIIYFDDKGLLPELIIEIINGQGAAVVLRPDPLVNVIRYEER